MLWAIFAILSLAVIAILVVPLLRHTEDAPPRVDYDIVVYRSQLAEIEQEIERGLLTPEQADAARAEVHRRMLAAEDAELKMPYKLLRSSSRYARFGAVVAIALILPLGALVLYTALGHPNLPGEPYSWRMKHDPDFVVAATAEKLEAMLKQNPTAVGYQRLAQMYFDTRHYDQAADADRKAVQLGANDASTWSEMGEALVMTNGGAVVPEALAAFAKAITIEPRSERSKFYIGLAEAQIGNLKQAVAIWRDLEQNSPADAPWLPMLREHITAFSKEGGFDPKSVPPGPPSPTVLNTSLHAMDNAMQLNSGPPSTQGAMGSASGAMGGSAPATISGNPMIDSMVQRLADRMQKNPNDADGWRRLAHAYNVLGKPDKAREAIDHAVRLKPNDVSVQLGLAEIEKASAAPGDDLPSDYVATMRKVLTLDGSNVQALYYVGLAEQRAGHAPQARVMWNKALSVAAKDDPLVTDIHNQFGKLKN